MSSESARLNWLETALAPLGQVNATVLGDFCLDAYWLFDTESPDTIHGALH